MTPVELRNWWKLIRDKLWLAAPFAISQVLIDLSRTHPKSLTVMAAVYLATIALKTLLDILTHPAKETQPK